jgi:hypothetical protein
MVEAITGGGRNVDAGYEIGNGYQLAATKAGVFVPEKDR